MPRPNKLRLLAAVLVLGLILLPASGALAGTHRQAAQTDDHTVSVSLVNPQLWALVFFTHLKLALSQTTATAAITPIGTVIISPEPPPEPDPNPLPMGPGGGGGCPTCSSGGGGDTGGGQDPDGG